MTKRQIKLLKRWGVYKHLYQEVERRFKKCNREFGLKYSHKDIMNYIEKQNILSIFSWRRTKNGAEYWLGVCNKLAEYDKKTDNRA